MANHKSAKKRIKTNEKKRIINKASLSKLKTLTKKAFDISEKAELEPAYKEAVSYIDKMASKGRIHKNNAARKKAQLTVHLNGVVKAK
jgi:small subunit ribosomal protein S20